MAFATPQDINLDETVGLQSGTTNEILASDLPSAFSFLTTYSGTATGGLDTAFPIIAHNGAFVSFNPAAGTTVSDLSFTHPVTGGGQAAFSPTTGFATTLKDIDGNTIYLFADPNHSDVILGRTGTSSSSPIAFAVALDESSDHLSAGVYVVLYEAMQHPDPLNANDVLDLTNFLNVSTASTNTVLFSDFADVPSGNTDYAIVAPDPGQPQGTNLLLTGQAPKGGSSQIVDSTVNVSSQGIGAGSQSVGQNATLQIDFINGGTQSTGTASQIAYTSHVETVTKTEFVLTQVNPTGELIDLKVAGANDTGNVQGSAFLDSAFTGVDLTRVQVYNASGVLVEDSAAAPNLNDPVTAIINSSGDAVVTNLQLNYKVVVYSGGMDQIQITNVDSSKNASFDVGKIQFSSSTPGSDTVEVGSHVNIYDDGPTLAAAAAFAGLSVDETNFATDATTSIAALFTASAGADEAAAATSGYSLVATGGVNTGLIDTATNTPIQLLQVDATHVEGRAGSLVVFEVSLSGGTLKLDQRLAIEHPVSAPDDPNQAISIDSSLASLLQIKGTLVDKDGDAATPVLINIADKLTFYDDGPTIDQTISGGNVAFVTGQHVTDTSISSAAGGDLTATGLQIDTYTDLANVTETLSSDRKTLQYSNASGDLFKLTVTNTGYDFLVQQTQQNASKTLDFGSVKAGGPQELLHVSTIDKTATVDFNGLIFTNTSDPRLAANDPGSASANDDLNPDSLGFGVKGGQASQMNNNEGFSAQLTGNSPTDTLHELSDFSFGMQAIGNVSTVTVTYWTVENGVLSAPHTSVETLPGGQGIKTFDINTPQGVDQIFVDFQFFQKDGTTPDTNAGVRLLNFTETEQSTFSAVDVKFTLRLDDNDTDTAVSNQVTIHVDPALLV